MLGNPEVPSRELSSHLPRKVGNIIDSKLTLKKRGICDRSQGGSFVYLPPLECFFTLDTLQGTITSHVPEKVARHF